MKHNQYHINCATSFIKKTLESKYQQDFEAVPQILGRLVKTYNRFQPPEDDAELHCDDEILSTDVLESLILAKIVKECPTASPMTEEENMGRRNLVDDDTDNNYHDCNIAK